MKKNKVYWTTKGGKKIDVDEMDIEHLRNTLKMIIRNKEENDKYDYYNPYMDAEIRDSYLND